MGQKLGVADVRLDWRAAIDELQPDVVVVATPARPHQDIVQFAASRGCHVLCEKPLATDATEARAMLEAVDRRGLKHGYGATSRYAPALVEARRLVNEGSIGDLREIEVVAHLGAPRDLAYSWVHRLADGGGILMNLLPHFLGQVQYLCDEVPAWATGRADPDIDRAPLGPVLHDFRDWAPVDHAGAATRRWHVVDADMRSTVVLGFETPNGGTVQALWHASFFTTGRHPAYLAIMGTEGTIHLTGHPWTEKLEVRRGRSDDWVEARLDQSQYADDPVQYGWNELTADFLADVAGQGRHPYPTFREGAVANHIIDRVRQSMNESVAL